MTTIMVEPAGSEASVFRIFRAWRSSGGEGCATWQIAIAGITIEKTSSRRAERKLKGIFLHPCEESEGRMHKIPTLFLRHRLYPAPAFGAMHPYAPSEATGFDLGSSDSNGQAKPFHVGGHR